MQGQVGLQCAEAPWGVTSLYQCRPYVKASSLQLHSSLCPSVWLQLGSSSGMEQSRVMAACQHRERCSPWGVAAGCAGVCGDGTRAGPEGRHSAPGLEGQRGAGTVCCIVAVSLCLGNK